MYTYDGMTIKVPGDCSIVIGGCAFTPDAAVFSMTSETGTFDVSEQNAKTTNCYNASNTDGTDRVLFNYTGSGGTVTLAMKTQYAYIPRIEIISEANPVDTAADISSVSIGLSDMIAVKFHVALDETVSADDYMDVTVGDKNYQIKVSETTTATSSVTGEECNVFECKVNSKEMSKLISVKMVVDGKEGTPVEYSVKKYANTILENAQGTYT